MKADRRIGCWAVSAAGLAVVSLTAYPPIRLSAQSRFWRPEDRALISDFSYVTAVAASPFTVFGATTHGLVVYDRQSRTWRLPVTTLDGYPASRVRAALADDGQRRVARHHQRVGSLRRRRAALGFGVRRRWRQLPRTRRARRGERRVRAGCVRMELPAPGRDRARGGPAAAAAGAAHPAARRRDGAEPRPGGAGAARAHPHGPAAPRPSLPLRGAFPGSERPVLRHRRHGTRARGRRDRRVGKPLLRLAQRARRRRRTRPRRRVGGFGGARGGAPRARVGGGRPLG